MRVPICFSAVVLLLAVAPAAAQQDAASGGKPPHASKHPVRTGQSPVPQTSGQGAYMGYCGDWFRCYTGIPLRCGDNTRPYQDIPNHACFCVHDGCPQQ